ncbi:hypothetical protein [Vibrio owensii]|uniref:hypothetical protein n=1 Tax=Vibrio owensii TaxID=696485 RepID=UPI003CE52C1F
MENKSTTDEPREDETFDQLLGEIKSAIGIACSSNNLATNAHIALVGPMEFGEGRITKDPDACEGKISQAIALVSQLKLLLDDTCKVQTLINRKIL